ncbi:hypothetical protein BD769DRAFT_1771703 [Suillus cothurnatus]|nr:hypothetical protein BD769DRAFT_1771703 [Suillus cothurnatus]
MEHGIFHSRRMPSISEDEMQKSVSSPQDAVAVELALKLYSSLDRLSDSRFAHHRLHLPCIAFPVTEVRRRPISYRLPQGRPARQSLLLVRPWDRHLLELPDYADDTENVDDFTVFESPGEQGLVDFESSERAMRLTVRLEQPFSAFLLAQQDHIRS